MVPFPFQHHYCILHFILWQMYETFCKQAIIDESTNILPCRQWCTRHIILQVNILVCLKSIPIHVPRNTILSIQHYQATLQSIIEENTSPSAPRLSNEHVKHVSTLNSQLSSKTWRSWKQMNYYTTKVAKNMLRSIWFTDI